LDNETLFVAHISNPNFRKGRGILDSWHDLDELSLIQVLEKNKVTTLFEEGLESSGIRKEDFFGTFPRVKSLYERVDARASNYLREFDRIEDEFLRKGIDYMLIKSDGSFPHESDNLDVLVKPDDLMQAVRVLRGKGYAEVLLVREPHKFLFERFCDVQERVAVHIHTRVEWEGTQFVSLERLWRRRKLRREDLHEIFAPSPEDYVLIAAAHLFFEDHNVKLRDLVRISLCIRNSNINWDYVLDHVKEQSWDNAFRLVMLLMNKIYDVLYGQEMLPPYITSRIEDHCSRHCRLLTKWLGGDEMPLRIPYVIPALFFTRKILGDTQSSVLERIMSLGFVASDVLRRRGGLRQIVNT